MKVGFYQLSCCERFLSVLTIQITSRAAGHLARAYDCALRSEGAVTDARIELRLNAPDLILLHLCPDTCRLSQAAVSGLDCTTVSDEVYSKQGKDAADFGMAGIGANNQARLHLCDVKHLKLIASIHAETAFFTAEVSLALLAADRTIRPEAVGRMVEAAVNFFDSCPCHEVHPAFLRHAAMYLQVMVIPFSRLTHKKSVAIKEVAGLA